MAKTVPSIADDDDVLIVTARLRSGRFESSIQVPLMAPDEEKHRFIDAWMTLMEAGVRCGPKKPT